MDVLVRAENEQLYLAAARQDGGYTIRPYQEVLAEAGHTAGWPDDELARSGLKVNGKAFLWNMRRQATGIVGYRLRVPEPTPAQPEEPR